LYKKKVTAIVLLSFVIVAMIGLGTIPEAKTPKAEKTAQFVISGWDYPDAYGQGIGGLKLWENSTGAWLAAPYYTDLGQFYYVNPDISGYSYNITAGTALKLRVDCVLNGTLTGVVSLAEGKNYIRHNVSVSLLGEIVFSQHNLTYSSGSDLSAPMYEYYYEVVLNFLAVMGSTYVMTVTYEVYYNAP